MRAGPLSCPPASSTLCAPLPPPPGPRSPPSGICPPRELRGPDVFLRRLELTARWAGIQWHLLTGAARAPPSLPRARPSAPATLSRCAGNRGPVTHPQAHVCPGRVCTSAGCAFPTVFTCSFTAHTDTLLVPAALRLPPSSLPRSEALDAPPGLTPSGPRLLRRGDPRQLSHQGPLGRPPCWEGSSCCPFVSNWPRSGFGPVSGAGWPWGASGSWNAVCPAGQWRNGGRRCGGLRVTLPSSLPRPSRWLGGVLLDRRGGGGGTSGCS